MEPFKKKKIVYILGKLCIGGAEKQIIQTAAHLDRELFIPKICCLSEGGPWKAYLDHHRVDTTILNITSRNTPLKIIKKLVALCRYLNQEQPDIVHCYMYTPSIYGGFCAKLLRIPVLITSRRRLGYFKDGKPHYQFLENVVNRFTDAILVNSHAVKNDILQRETIDPDKIYLVHNGVNIHEFKPASAEHEKDPHILQLKESLGIPENSPVIGMISNFFQHKGHQEFIIAAAEVQRQYPQVRFLCMGEDWGVRQNIEQLCCDLGIYNYFTFLEGMHTHMPEFFRFLNILVSASYEEGFSNTILEGMASGKPVIATSVGGTPEAVLHNVTGILIPPKNPAALAQAMIRLLHNPELAFQLGCSGRKRVEENFSLERMLEKLRTLYLELSES